MAKKVSSVFRTVAETQDFMGLSQEGRNAWTNWHNRYPNAPYSEWQRQGRPGSTAPSQGTVAVPEIVQQPALDPDQQEANDAKFWNIMGEGINNELDYQNAIASNKLVEEQLKDNYNRGIRNRGEELGGRGIASAGISDAHMWDVTRADKLATTQQANVMSAAAGRYTAFIGNLNNRLRALDDGRDITTLVNAHSTPGGFVAPPKAAQPAAPAAPAPAAAPRPVVAPSNANLHPKPGVQLARPGQQARDPQGNPIGMNLNPNSKKYVISPGPGGTTKTTRLTPAPKVKPRRR